MLYIMTINQQQSEYKMHTNDNDNKDNNMEDHTKDLITIVKIVNALNEAKNGVQVYIALKEIPTENLIHMYHMIEDILNSREQSIN
jgi:hypothetical protein